MTFLKTSQQHKSGFALLLSLIVLSVVVSVVLSMVEITIKQLRLSTIGKDSEIAFHASSAGVECLRYWRLTGADDFESGNGNDVSMACFGASATDRVSNTLTPASGPGSVYQYGAQLSWGTPARCSILNFIVIASEPSAGVDTVFDIDPYLDGYPGETVKECPPGGKCTFVSSKGYNTACTNVGSTIGIVEREVLLEL